MYLAQKLSSKGRKQRAQKAGTLFVMGLFHKDNNADLTVTKVLQSSITYSTIRFVH